MKLKNKRTGEIMEFDAILPVKDVSGDSVAHLEYDSLAELNAEWEDYEEPKKMWFISNNGQIHNDEGHERFREERKQIGNYFDTQEEAEQAVEKLKAWKRMKDKKFKFREWRTADIGGDKYYFVITAEADDADKADLDLLFSGGEE